MTLSSTTPANKNTGTTSSQGTLEAPWSTKPLTLSDDDDAEQHGHCTCPVGVDDALMETTIVNDLEQGHIMEVTVTSAVNSNNQPLDSNNHEHSKLLTVVQEETSIPDTLPTTFTSITSCSNCHFIDEEASLHNIHMGGPISSTLAESTETIATTAATDSPIISSTCITSTEAEFLAVVRFCIYIGKAAFRYGSPGSKVEVFLQRLMEDRFGYYLGMFRATQSELLCSVCAKEDDPPRTFFIAIESGLNLHKLGLLADLVDRVVPSGPEAVSRLEAMAQLKEIEAAPDPWGKLSVFISFPLVGAGLSMVLGGSWWDVGVASALAIICFSTMEYLPRWNARFAQWIPLVTAFWVSTIATILQRTCLVGLHVTLVTLSAIAVLLPGYTVSMGIGELISNRIISGAANLVGGMVCLFWLVIGAWLGEAFGASVTNNYSGMENTDDSTTTTWDSVPTLWQTLFIPMLCFSLIVAFQVSRRDVLWCFSHLILTYLTFVVTGLVLEWTLPDDNTSNDVTNATIMTNGTSGNVQGDDHDPPTLLGNGGRNLQTYFSTVVCCLVANTWAIRTNRPNSILLVPALVFLVSGSIGFRGLLTLLTADDEDKSLGTSQFLQMIIVALLIVAGLMTGNTLVEPSSTL